MVWRSIWLGQRFRPDPSYIRQHPRPLQLERSKVSSEASNSAFDPPHQSVVRVTQRCRTLGNRIEHRLKVCRRAGDHPQDIAGRGLPLQRLSKFPRLRIESFLQVGVRRSGR